MNKNKTCAKGFTLIELLAVIVILAIIALIATPIVLDIIENSKASSLDRSEHLYLDSVNQSLARYQLNNKTIADGVYYIMENNNLCLKLSQDSECDQINEIKVDVDGEAPKQGYIGVVNNQIRSYDFRKKDYSEGNSILKATIVKAVDEETGEPYVDLTITTEENVGMMTIMLNLIYNENNLKYNRFIRGYLRDYNVNLISTNEIQFINIESGNLHGTTAMITFRFNVNNLDDIKASDFIIYVTSTNWKGKTVLIKQSQESEVKIINGSINSITKKISTSSKYIPGDINGDKYVDLDDLAILKKGLLGTGENCKAMDVNGDNSINILDLVRFKNYFLGLEQLEYSSIENLPDHL